MTKVVMSGPVADPKPGGPRVSLLPASDADKSAQSQGGEPSDSQLTGPEEAYGSLLCGRNRPPKRPK
jgi:hypothetical protein